MSTNELLFHQLYLLQVLDFHLDDFHDRKLNIMAQLRVRQPILKVLLRCLQVFAIGVRSWTQDLHQTKNEEYR